MSPASFAGKDFLSMDPPKNYRPGIGRGAVAFSTRGNIGAPAPAHKFSKDDEKAAQVWASVDKRRKRAQPDPDRFQDAESEQEAAKNTAVQLGDWLAMPEATDKTMRTKRLRNERNDTRRTYSVPDSLLEEIGVDYAAMTRQDPTNPQGWINYAKQLHSMNQFKKARSTIDKGCTACPHHSVWSCAIDLRQSLDDKRQVAARAVEALPCSLELWNAALELETASQNRLAVLHKAIEAHPAEPKLWLQAIRLESDRQLQLEMVKTATTFCANDELYLLWHGLSGDVQHLEWGLSRCPTPRLWLARNKLEENKHEPPKGDWYAALDSLAGEGSGGPLRDVIVRFNLDPEKVPAWLKLEAYSARADSDPAFLLPWAKLAEDPRVPLERAVEAKELGAKAWEAYIAFDPQVLARAYQAFPSEFRQQYSEVHGLDPQTEAEFVAQATKQASLAVCQAGLVKFPKSSELYMLAYKLGDKDALATGMAQAPSAGLWEETIRAEPFIAKKRLLLARCLKTFNCENIWLLKVDLDPQTARQAVAACPSSGRLWAIWLDQLDPKEKKKHFREALEKTGNGLEVVELIKRFKKH